MKKYVLFFVAVFAVALIGCGCGSSNKQETANPPEHIRGNISRIFLHDPGVYNWYANNYSFIPGYYSVLEKNAEKKLLWHNFCDTHATVIVDVEKGAQCWFEADIRTDEKRKGAYTNVVIHIWSENQIERGNCQGSHFGHTDD